jgi:hypothetical protein
MDRPEVPAGAAPRGWRGRDWLMVFVAAASVFKILTSLTLAGVFRESLRDGTFPAVVPIAHILVFSGAALFLATAGSRDRRALHLGSFFLLIAVAFSNGMLVRVAGLEAWPQRIQAAMLALHPNAFLPLFLWRFVAQFPRLRRFDRGESVERAFISASVALGAICFFASALIGVVRDTPLEFLAAMAWGGESTGFDTVMFGLAIPALPFGLWKAKRAEAVERRRYRLFLTGILGGFLPLALQVLAEALFPSLNAFMSVPPRGLIAGLVLFPLFLSIPLTTTYSVVVHRVLDVRLILRKAVRYALARYTLLAFVLVLAVALGAALVEHREQSLGTLLTTSSGLSIILPLAVLLGLLAVRRSLLDAIDRRFFREAIDARALLTDLAATAVASGETLESVCQRFSQSLQSSLHVVQAEVLVADWEHRTLKSAAGRLRDLSLEGPLCAALSSRRDGIVIELDRPDSFVSTLTPDEQQWLADGAVHLLMPLASGSDFVGVMVLGEKLSDLPFTPEDHRLLAPVAAALALRIENLRLRDIRTAAVSLDPSGSSRQEAEAPAQVCVSCFGVAPHGLLSCPRCLGSLTPIQLPLVLAGKFRLERELGRGGMGVVYLATDTGLDRRVAIKSLPRVSVGESVRLRREARAMAAFAHPNLASIFGIESFRGSPALVMEYLEGGTLADLLLRGPLTPAETTALARELSGALALIHNEGLLHRDIKPSNIAFTAARRPKLLDFGLAQMLIDHAPVREAAETRDRGQLWMSVSDLTTADRPGGVAGTPGYMAPEARSGQSLDGGADLWSFGVVLFECLTGERPFKGSPASADFSLILEERAPECPPYLRELVADLLTIDRRKRPRSAREILGRLPFEGSGQAA